MFVPCPHCGYLAALLVSQHDVAQRCPRCKGALLIDVGDAAATASAATATTAAAVTVEGDAVALGTPTDRRPHEPLHGASHTALHTPSPIAPATAVTAENPRGNEDETVANSQPSTASSATLQVAVPSNAAAAEDRSPAKPAPSVGTTSPASRARPAPSFVRRHARRSDAPRHRRWPNVLAIAVLATLLVLQLALSQREELAADARWRPWIAGVCDALHCDVPPWREPSAFTMIARNVQPSARAPGVLAVTASFRNDARWPQPWPTLLLSLSDVEGRTVGLRAFTAAEYRHDAGTGDIAPGRNVSVQLDVIEPAPRIVAFTFDFR